MPDYKKYQCSVCVHIYYAAEGDRIPVLHRAPYGKIFPSIGVAPSAAQKKAPMI
jgi:rubredoxin